jgi:hypothetical protein
MSAIFPVALVTCARAGIAQPDGLKYPEWMRAWLKLLIAGLIAGCAGSPPPARSIDAVERSKVNRVEIALRFHRESVRDATKLDALVRYFNARTGNWSAPGAEPPPATRASLIFLEADGTHRVMGLGCGFFSTARSTQAHSLRDAESYRVRPMTAADLGELLKTADNAGLNALFTDCKL